MLPLLLVLIMGACTSQRPPNYKRTQPSGGSEASKDPKPVESHPLNQGRVEMDSDVRDPVPLRGKVEIKTWANELIKGELVQETEDEYVVNTTPPEAEKPQLRRVKRSAVMELKAVR
jgi:hypothetical protein